MSHLMHLLLLCVHNTAPRPQQEFLHQTGADGSGKTHDWRVLENLVIYQITTLYHLQMYLEERVITKMPKKPQPFSPYSDRILL